MPLIIIEFLELGAIILFLEVKKWRYDMKESDWLKSKNWGIKTRQVLNYPKDKYENKLNVAHLKPVY